MLVSVPFQTWLIVLPAVLLAADVLRCCGAHAGSEYQFDGERWWRLSGSGASDPLEQRDPGYAGPLLVALRLTGPGGNRDLLVWRWQCRRERWRRLSLAALHARSPVSPE